MKTFMNQIFARFMTVNAAVAGLERAKRNLSACAQVQDAAALAKQEKANNLFNQAQAAREEAARARVTLRNITSLVG